jgi:hypothetical protein
MRRARTTATGLLVFGMALPACSSSRVESIGRDGGPGSPGGSGSGAGDGPTLAVPDAADGGLEAPPPRPPTSGEQCVEEAIRGEQLPLDLMLVLDASGSMNLDVGGQTRWKRVTDALKSFMADPRSAGLGVGLQVFPFSISEKPCRNDGDCGGDAARTGFYCSRPFLCMGPGVAPATARSCDPNDAFCPTGTDCEPSGRCTGSGARCVNLGQACPGGGGNCGDAPLVCKLPMDSCEVTDYERPRLPLAVLPAALPGLSGGLDGIKPGGNTPIAPAVTGATRYLRQHLAANPGRRGALVLASDASPNVCAGADVAGVVAAIETARAGNPSLPSYVIGAVSPGDVIRADAAARFAQAGGTGSPIIVSNVAADLGNRFLEALSTIRGSALPCEFRIAMPSTGTIDFGKVNVRFVGAGGASDLSYVGSSDRCDPAKGGWYYDVDPAAGAGKPARIRLCPTTCEALKGDPKAKADLAFGCATRSID